MDSFDSITHILVNALELGYDCFNDSEVTLEDMS